jgi:hypothetical protein
MKVNKKINATIFYCLFASFLLANTLKAQSIAANPNTSGDINSIYEKKYFTI